MTPARVIKKIVSSNVLFELLTIYLQIDRLQGLSYLISDDGSSLTGVLLGMCILSALFGITGLLVAALIIFKTRRKNRHKKDADGVQNVQLEELEEQNMTQHYDDVHGTGVERGYTTVGPSDQETPYEELNSI